MTLTIIIKTNEDGLLYGYLKELPDVFTQGISEDEIKKNISDSLEYYFDPPTFEIIYED